MLLEVAIIFVSLILCLNLYLKRKWTYWTEKGVYQVHPTFPVGSFPEMFSKKEHLNDVFAQQAKGELYYVE